MLGGLERAATAVWITKMIPGENEESRARELTRIKPHVSHDAPSLRFARLTRCGGGIVAVAA